MTIETVAGTDLKYFLICYTKQGKERTDDPDAPAGLLSAVVLDAIRDQEITDVFFVSHGWKGDIPAAKDQYQRWLSAMSRCPADLTSVHEAREGFNPLIVGLHWPSLPWGDEDHARVDSFSTDGSELQNMIEDAADKIADTPKARKAIETIFVSAMEDIAPAQLPEEVVAAYRVLWQEAGISAEGPDAPPGSDSEPFDPESRYQDSLGSAISFGGGFSDGLLSPLRQLSFWKMKKRARRFGEKGGGELLRNMQMSVPEGRGVRFHLMGHSFGCIVVSACVSGAGGGSSLPRPVDTVYLVQGALSLWAYCSNIPVSEGQQGYFNDIVSQEKVRGPIITTQSEHDTAVGKLYPLAAGAAQQVDMAPGEVPKYGAMGSFGIQGPGVDIENRPMRPIDTQYDFMRGVIYNLECSKYISEGGGLSGAHNDIAKAEVAHAFWQGILS